MDRQRPSASELEEKIPEAWIGQEVMIRPPKSSRVICGPQQQCTWKTSTSGVSSCW